MELAHIRACVAAYRPRRIEAPHVARAAVALALADAPGGVTVLLIERATRDDDPWSGHIALPGGRRDPDDADAVATAVRETREEVGVDLLADGTILGRLDELRATARHRPLDLVIAPIVFALHRPVALSPSPREVESAVWVPLAHLASPDARGTYTRTVDEVTADFPALRFGTYTVWGLTHSILEGFLQIVGRGAT